MIASQIRGPRASLIAGCACCGLAASPITRELRSEYPQVVVTDRLGTLGRALLAVLAGAVFLWGLVLTVGYSLLLVTTADRSIEPETPFGPPRDTTWMILGLATAVAFVVVIVGLLVNQLGVARLNHHRHFGRWITALLTAGIAMLAGVLVVGAVFPHLFDRANIG